MMIIDVKNIDFKINTDEVTGLISGFSLKAIGDDLDTKRFCIAFPGNMTMQRARIFIEDDEIIFKYDGVPFRYCLVIGMEIFRECELRLKIDKQEAERLSQFLTHQGPYAGCKKEIRYEFKDGFGFTVYIKQKPGQIVIVNTGSDTPENCPARLPSDYYSQEK